MIDIRIFGSTVVEHGGRRYGAADLGGVKPRQLLEMLALDLGAPQAKDALAERLWEGEPPASYRATLESYVCVLRRRLGLAQGRRAALATTTSGYLLDPEQVRVDAVEVRARLESGTDADVPDALSRVSADLLADEPYAAWATRERERFADLLAAACIRAACSANEVRDHTLAGRLARAGMRHSYFSEPALRELMRALVASGERSQALRAYEQHRRGVLEELGVEPSPLTHRLYLSILQGECDADGAAGRDEVKLLVRLLRHALENDPEGPLGEPAVLEVSRLLLARAG